VLINSSCIQNLLLVSETSCPIRVNSLNQLYYLAFVSPFVMHNPQFICSILKSTSERQLSRPRHRREENIDGCPKDVSSSEYSNGGLFYTRLCSIRGRGSFECLRARSVSQDRLTEMGGWTYRCTCVSATDTRV